jgi:hypothetical protein
LARVLAKQDGAVWGQEGSVGQFVHTVIGDGHCQGDADVGHALQKLEGGDEDVHWDTHGNEQAGPADRGTTP